MSCAAVMAPPGGDKDVIPPELIKVIQKMVLLNSKVDEWS